MRDLPGKPAVLHVLLTAVFATLFFLPAGGLPDAFSPVNSVTGPGMVHGVVVTNTTPDAAVIRFRTDDSCIPVIRYYPILPSGGTSPGERTAAGILSCTTHAIPLSGLIPDTRYVYQITNCGSNVSVGSFFTFPDTGTCRFVVYGDTREQLPFYNQTSRHLLVADRIAEEEEIRFVVNSGDLVADSSDNGEWMRFFSATEVLRSNTTYRAVPGNHDRDRVRLRELFGTSGFTYFDCGTARIMLIDSTDEAGEDLDSQARHVLVASAGFPGAKIIILHHPPYSSDEKHNGGWENLQSGLVPVFEKAGISLVFSGHVHAFEQVEHSGITYITEARGGAPSYPLNKTRIPGSLRAYENSLGYSRVTVDPASRMIKVDVIRVADVSPDLRTLTRVYPAGTADAQIVIPYGRSRSGIMDISDITGLSMLRQGTAA